MNIYRLSFSAKCPANGRVVEYELSIRTSRMIMVEDIAKACAELKAYHEDIADRLYNKFGGYQVIMAHHHGVDIETRRGREWRKLD